METFGCALLLLAPVRRSREFEAGRRGCMPRAGNGLERRSKPAVRRPILEEGNCPSEATVDRDTRMAANCAAITAANTSVDSISMLLVLYELEPAASPLPAHG